MKFTDKTKLMIAGVAVLAIALFLSYYQKTPALSLDPNRKEIYVVKGTFLRTQKMELRSVNGQWFIIEAKFGTPVEIATPYSMRFNANYKAVLEPNGTLAMVTNDHLERSELRWMDNQWKHQDPSTTEWLEFGEPDPPR